MTEKANTEAKRLTKQLKAIKKSLAKHPMDLKLLFQRGYILYQLEKYETAKDAFSKAIEVEPNFADGFNARSIVNHALGKFSDAIYDCEHALSINPRYKEALLNLARAQQELHQYDEALNNYTKAIALDQKYFNGFLGRALIWKTLNHHDKALDDLNKAVSLNPSSSKALLNRGAVKKALGRLDESLADLQSAIALQPDLAEAHNNLGNTLRELGKFQEAETSYIKAIELKPNYAEAHCNLGVALRELGKFQEAQTRFTQAIVLKPEYAEAHRTLANIKTFHSQDEQYLKMRELYLNPNIQDEDRCFINFGLAKACEDLGDFEQAYFHYNEGNAIRKKIANYDKSQDTRLFKALKSNYPQISKVFLEPDNFAHKLTPIFILGMPRSGTTIVEQIISSHPEVTGAGELNLISQFGHNLANGESEINSSLLAEFRANYFEKIKHFASGNEFITDKMPQNFRYIGLIATALPEAKIIHVKRDPAAVCWANYKTFFPSEGLGYCFSIEDTIHYVTLYEDLMEFWESELSNKIHTLNYEQLTVNQEKETKTLIDFIGLDWHEACLSPQDNKRGVSTASSIQVRQKVYQGSSQKWKKYEPFLNGAFDKFL
ncbi:tetratricopeptide repeat protein [Alphaproteobacteria bacterium]|nr:tetratricopeptide repeat protein [Alphaproteobacteria bacterium]